MVDGREHQSSTSVQGRLLLAFLAISAFVVVAAGAGNYAFRQVANVLDRVTEQRAPMVLAALELSRQAERIAAAAPALLTVRSPSQLQEITGSIRQDGARLAALLADVRATSIEMLGNKDIERAVEGLRRNLDFLDRLVAGRIAVTQQKEELLRQLGHVTIAAQRIVGPRLLLMDSKIAALRRATGAGGATQSSTEETIRLAQTIAANVPLQKAQLEFASINDGLVRAASAPDWQRSICSPFPSAVRSTSSSCLPPILIRSSKPRFVRQINALSSLIAGTGSIPEVRIKELELTARDETLIGENVVLSTQLTTAVDALVDAARKDISDARSEALSAQWFGRSVLIGASVLSLLASLMIVWLYVQRRLIARLTALSNSMLAISGGNLRAPVPEPVGFDEIARMARALAVFRDTAVEIEEHNLREVGNARQRLLDAIESISEGFAFFNAEDRLELCNTHYREFFDDPEGKLIHPGMTFSEIVRATAEANVIDLDGGDVEGYVAERIALHEAAGPTTLRRLADGRWVQTNERKMEGGGTVATYIDLTELKHREAELAEIVKQLESASERAMEATRAKSQFLANMSHELRTPLNAIIGYSEMLYEEAAENGQERSIPDLDRIQGAAKHLLRLINDILDLSKVEAGKMDVVIEDFEVAKLVNQVRSMIEPLVIQNRNLLKVRCEGDLGEMHSDETKIQQNLVNLLSNAAKFTKGNLVELEVRRFRKDAADWLEFRVADRGIGMTPEQLSRIFQAFNQADATTARDYGGTGLGLALTKRYCDLLGGDISVESTFGEGTTFTMRLPAAVPDVSQADLDDGAGERLVAWLH